VCKEEGRGGGGGGGGSTKKKKTLLGVGDVSVPRAGHWQIKGTARDMCQEKGVMMIAFIIALGEIM